MGTARGSNGQSPAHSWIRPHDEGRDQPLGRLELQSRPRQSCSCEDRESTTLAATGVTLQGFCSGI
jgi:hypothetical protein